MLQRRDGFGEEGRGVERFAQRDQVEIGLQSAFGIGTEELPGALPPGFGFLFGRLLHCAEGFWTQHGSQTGDAAVFPLGPGLHLIASVVLRGDEDRRRDGDGLVVGETADVGDGVEQQRLAGSLGPAFDRLEQLGARPVLAGELGLAWSCYPTPGTRNVQGADVLVQPGSLLEAEAALAELGWAAEQPPSARPEATRHLRSADDARRYRGEEEVKAAWTREPVSRLRTYLTAAGVWDEAQETDWNAACAKEIDIEINAYLETPVQPVSAMFDFLYADMPPEVAAQREAAIAAEGRRHG